MTSISSKLPGPIGAINIRRSIKQVLIATEVIPHVLVDVVGKRHEALANICGTINDAVGFESLHDAIVEAENIGARFFGEVKPENLLFIFGETLQSLQASLREFADEHSVAYCAEDFYAPIHAEQDARNDEGEKEIWAIVLCKLKASKLIEPVFGAEKEKGANDRKRYEVTWGELQRLKNRARNVGDHSAGFTASVKVDAIAKEAQ